MKQFLLSILFLCFGFTKSQTLSETLTENTWYLIDFDEGSEYGFYGTMGLPELELITLNFFMENNELHYQTQVCQNKIGDVMDIIESEYSEIYFGNSELSGDECIDSYAQGYETAYFDHIYEKDQYWLNITEQSDGSLTLNINSPNFCYATFSNQLFSTQENEQSGITFYPNPVHDKLTIENLVFKINQIKITGSNGKVIFSQNVNSAKSEIDFSKYPNGVYFLSIESNGKTKTEKIIKN